MTAWTRFSARAALFLLPLLLAALVAGWGLSRRASVHEPWDDYLRPVAVEDVSELEHLFERLDYSWPPAPGRSVPRIAIEPLPVDYDRIEDIGTRKSVFFRVLLPLVLAENARILQERAWLTEIFDAGAVPGPGAAPGRFVRRLLDDYRVAGDPDDPAVRAELLRRVDMIPVALVLAQAANESGWGTSRFAREGNNLFGVWTYRPDAGIVPAARAEGETHALRVFDSLRDSVRDHLHNLNIGHAYGELRRLRADIRAQGGTLDSVILAGGLARYSSRGEDYIGEIQAIIRSNHLRAVRGADLRAQDLRAGLSAPAGSRDG